MLCSCLRKGDLLFKTYNMKKALGIISLIVVIIWIIVSISWQWEKIKGIEDSVNDNKKQIEDIVYKKFKINNFSMFVDEIYCQKWDFEHSWTIFYVKIEWKNYAFTNKHNVIEDSYCKTRRYGWLDWSQSFTFNGTSDFIWLPISAVYDENRVPTMDIPLCDKIQITSNVWTIWYPWYTDREQVDKEKYNRVLELEQIIAWWAISWYTTEPNNWVKQKHVNYYITNLTDQWNSWWPAIAETDDWFCLLWIVTWGKYWKDNNASIVQNIHNVVE